MDAISGCAVCDNVCAAAAAAAAAETYQLLPRRLPSIDTIGRSEGKSGDRGQEGTQVDATGAAPKAVATIARLDLRATPFPRKHRNMSRTTAQEVADAMETSHLSSASSDQAEERRGAVSGPSRDAQARRSSLEDRRLPPPLSPRIAQDSTAALEQSAPGPSRGSATGRLNPSSQLDTTLRRSGPEDMSRSTSGGVMLRRCSTESARSLDFDSDVSDASPAA